jgi:hypothetical protein
MELEKTKLMGQLDDLENAEKMLTNQVEELQN